MQERQLNWVNFIVTLYTKNVQAWPKIIGETY